MKPTGWIIAGIGVALTGTFLAFVSRTPPRPKKLTPEQRILRDFNEKYTLYGKATAISDVAYWPSTGEPLTATVKINIPRQEFFNDPKLSGDHTVDFTVDFNDPPVPTRLEHLHQLFDFYFRHIPLPHADDQVFIYWPSLSQAMNDAKAAQGKEKPENIAVELRLGLNSVGSNKLASPGIAKASLLEASLDIEAQDWPTAQNALDRAKPAVAKHPEFKPEYDRLTKSIPKQ